MKLRMRDLKRTLVGNGVKVEKGGFYVDDVRLITGLIPPGVRWCQEENQLRFEMEWLDQDLKDTQPLEERTSKTILSIMNTLAVDLKFTLELPSEFPNNRVVDGVGGGLPNPTVLIL